MGELLDCRCLDCEYREELSHGCTELGCTEVIACRECKRLSTAFITNNSLISSTSRIDRCKHCGSAEIDYIDADGSRWQCPRCWSYLEVDTVGIWD